MNCHVVLFVDSSMIGGIETHILELYKLLSNNHVSCSVLFYQNHQNYEFYKLLDKEKVKYAFVQGTLSSLIKQLAKYDKQTVIHTHGYKAGILGRVACKIMGRRCISTYHAGEAGTGKMWLYNKLDIWLSRFSTNFAVSDKIKDTLHNATLLENFIDLPLIKPQHKPNEPLRVGFVGRLSYEKAPDIFFSLANNMQDNLNVNFHLFGDGPMKGSIPKLNNLQYYGLAKRDDIWHKIDVLLICSREEGLPMTLLEAMAENKLVISSPVGAIPSIINHTNGLLMGEGNERECQHCIETLLTLTPEDRASMARNAYAVLEERFSGKKQLSLLLNAYNAH